MRSLVFHEKSGDKPVGRIFVGTMNIRPSGIGTRRPRRQNVGLAVGVVRADELIAKPERAAEIGGPGLFGDEGIRPGFDDASVDVLGAEDSAEARGRFVENVLDRALRRVASSSSAKAAARPEMPPPMMAMRVMDCDFRLSALAFRKPDCESRRPARILLHEAREILHVFDRSFRQECRGRD